MLTPSPLSRPPPLFTALKQTLFVGVAWQGTAATAAIFLIGTIGPLVRHA